MAVHENPNNKTTPNQGTGINSDVDTSTDNLSDAKPLRNAFGAVPFGVIGANTTQQTQYLQEVFEEVLKLTGKQLIDRWGITHKLQIIKSGAKGGGNPLISDAVVISFTKDGETVVSSIILADPDVPITPLRVPARDTIIYRGDPNLMVVRTMRDLDSKVYRQYLTKTAAGAHPNTNITILRSTVISAELEKGSDGQITHGGNNPVHVQAVVLRVIQSMMIKLGIDILHQFEDITVEEVAKLGGVIGLDVSEPSANTTTFDGVIIRPKRRMTFDIRSEDDLDANGAITRDVHNAQNAHTMGTLNLSTEVRHLNVQPVQAGISAGGPVAPVYHKGWSPTIIIDSIEMPNHPSLATVSIMVATLAGFMTPEIIMSMFENNIRFLSVISNITGKSKPEPITKKAMSEHFREFYSAIFADTYTIGMRVRPGTTSFITDVDLLKLAGSSKTVYILSHLGKQFGGKKVDPNDLINKHIDVHPTGTFPDAKGNILPLTKFDIRYLLEHFPDEVAMHREWLIACTSRMSREERLAVKTRIITDAVGSPNITGTDYIVYFSSPVIAALRDQIVKSLILAPNNIMTGGFADLSWAIHGAGNIGFDFSGNNIGNVGTGGFYL